MIDADGQGTIDIKELSQAVRPATLKHRSNTPVAAVVVPKPPFPRRGYRATTTVLIQPPPPRSEFDPYESVAALLNSGTRPPSAAASGPGAAVSNWQRVPTLPAAAWAAAAALAPAPAPAPAPAGSCQPRSHHAASAVELYSQPPLVRPQTVDTSIGRGGGGGLSVSQSMPALHPYYPRASSAPPLRYKEPPATINPYSVPKTRPAVEAFYARPATPSLQLGRTPSLVQMPLDAQLLRSPSMIRKLKTGEAQVEWFRSYVHKELRNSDGRGVL